MIRIEGVLFDLDGTLVDSLPELYEGVRRTCVSYRITPPTKEAVGAMIGRGPGVLVDRLFDYLKLHDSGIDQTAFYRRMIDHWAETGGSEIAYCPGAVEGIRKLRAQGIRCALVTNKLRSLTLEFLQARGIEELFDAVVAGDDCEHAKPAPDMLHRALSDIGVSAEHAVMVGDSRNDALAARAAGVTAVLVETGYNEGVSIGEWAREAGFSHIWPNVGKVCDRIAAGAPV